MKDGQGEIVIEYTEHGFKAKDHAENRTKLVSSEKDYVMHSWINSVVVEYGKKEGKVTIMIYLYPTLIEVDVKKHDPFVFLTGSKNFQLTLFYNDFEYDRGFNQDSVFHNMIMLKKEIDVRQLGETLDFLKEHLVYKKP